MDFCRESQLIETIFRVFPKAVIVKRTEIGPEQKANAPAQIAELAMLAKKRPSVLRASKRKVSDDRQLTLFDDPKPVPLSIRQAETTHTASRKRKIRFEIVSGQVIPFPMCEGVAYD